MTPDFALPLLVCDIGGTNVRVAAVHEAGKPPRAVAHVATNSAASFEAAIKALCEAKAIRPASIIACAAGPVTGRRVRLTNADWLIDGESVAKTLGLSQGLLLNDFEAQALSLPAIEPGWTRPIGLPVSDANVWPQVILGPGTGLGCAALLDQGGMYISIPSEASHAGFGPASEDDELVWPYLARAQGRWTMESVVSGVGLARLHTARALAAGREAPDQDAPAIVEQALADAHGPARLSVAHFLRLTARVAGDLALIFLARGGVTLSGGVLPRIATLIDDDEFRAAFEDKAPMKDLVHQIPVRLIVHEDTVLAGLAAVAGNPARYGIDYARRAWVV